MTGRQSVALAPGLPVEIDAVGIFAKRAFDE